MNNAESLNPFATELNELTFGIVPLREVSEKAGLSAARVTDIRHGDRLPTAEEAVLLARALGQDEDDWLCLAADSVVWQEQRGSEKR